MWDTWWTKSGTGADILLSTLSFPPHPLSKNCCIFINHPMIQCYVILLLKQSLSNQLQGTNFSLHTFTTEWENLNFSFILFLLLFKPIMEHTVVQQTYVMMFSLTAVSIVQRQNFIVIPGVRMLFAFPGKLETISWHTVPYCHWYKYWQYIHLPKPVFSHRLSYATLLRVHSLVLASTESGIRDVVNCVCSEMYEWMSRKADSEIFFSDVN